MSRIAGTLLTAEARLDPPSGYWTIVGRIVIDDTGDEATVNLSLPHRQADLLGKRLTTDVPEVTL